ncbi:MAG: flagellar protein FlaG [Labrys sp. (in: a-proteobacteria)]
MDITTVRKAAVALAPPVRPTAAMATEAVATELPDKETVGSTQESDRATLDSSDTRSRIMATAEAAVRQIERRNFVDERTNDYVFQAVNQDTGEVVSQIPAEVNLRLRAYVRADEESQNQVTRVA